VREVPRGILHAAEADALPELPGEVEVKSTFRRLARELVIFIFIAGFIGTSIGIAYEFEQTKPVAPDVPPGVTLEPIPNGALIGSGPPCTAAADLWKMLNPDGLPCQETPEQGAAREARFEAGEKAKRQERLLNVTAFGVFGFGFGGLAGVVLWVFYRGARFAIKG
jgi:hypothetical protein